MRILVKSKPKVTITLTSPLYKRNFIDSGAFNGLVNDFELHFLVPHTSAMFRFELGSNLNIHYFHAPSISENESRLTFETIAWRYRNRSISFKYREQRHYPSIRYRLIANVLGLGPDKLFQKVAGATENQSESRNLSSSVSLSKLFRILERFRVKFLGTKLVFPIFKVLVLDRKIYDGDLGVILKDLDPALAIYVSSAHEITGIHFVEVCNQLSIKNLFLIDNWDNLSSKTVFWRKPDYLATWGPQSNIHAVKIQGMKSENCLALGSPRFQLYFDSREKASTPPFKFRYVLYLGTSLPMNEVEVLQILDKEISSKQEIYRGLKIVYRPHPWRHSSQILNEADFQNLVIDPQVKDQFTKQANDIHFQPNLDYYPALLANCEFAMGGLTSMLIEATSMKKNFLAFVYKEPFSIYSPQKVHYGYEHFKELSTLPNLVFVRKKSEIAKKFRELAINGPIYSDETLDERRNFFLYSDSKTYSERLSNAVWKIITSANV
jgi:hypothetical protein